MKPTITRDLSSLSAGEIFAWIFVSFVLPIVMVIIYGSIYLLFYAILFSKYWYISVIVVSYLILDNDATSRGERTWTWMREHFILAKWIASLFPVKLIKTVDLDPEKNYIFGVHPHGVISPLCNFITDATGFSTLFPGIQPHMVMIPFYQNLPIFKELSMFLGAISPKPEHISHVLSKEKGRAVVMTVGGAYEVMDIHPGTMIITLKKRKGFVRMALKHGASLVPVISFGDNDILQTSVNPPGSLTRRWQEACYKKCRASFGVMYGPNYGLANIVPINTIVGEPIHVEKVEEPTSEMIDALHSQYIEALQKLFNLNKEKYSNNDDLKLEIRY